jgi:hypothetical protein
VAEILFVYLPFGAAGEKVGVDDYLAAAHTVDDLLALATPMLRTPAGGDAPGAPYASRPHGLVRYQPTRDGTVEVPLSNFTAEIVTDIAEDDGAETRRMFEMEVSLEGVKKLLTIPAASLKSMNWVAEMIGAKAVIYAGQGTADHARVAIQLLSSNIAERTVYTHTGWRNVGGEWVYLHGGGAIGANGLVPGIAVRLPPALHPMVLPDPPTGAALTDAMRASMRMLQLAPLSTVLPTYAAIWRSVLGGADFSVHLAGPTGSFKTELAALAQQHLGAGLDARHLPGSWSSTANSLEALAFAAKDMVFVVDDFAPAGSIADVQRMHKDADRLIRNQGNQAGRGRLRADGTLRPARPPRGLTVSTGEDVPKGQSLGARMWVTEIPRDGPGAIDATILTTCQKDAAAGLYAQAVAGFLQWLAPRYEAVRTRLKDEMAALRREAYQSGEHRRTPDIVANLGVGLSYVLAYAQEAGAVARDEGADLWSGWWKALGEAAAAQGEHQAASEPTLRFLELIASATASGLAHLADAKGGAPPGPEAWGWRLVTVGAGENPFVEWRPQGQRIGWLDGDDLYLDAIAAYSVAQRLARDGGDPVSVTLRTLKRRLRERGLLASTEHRGGRERLEVRRNWEGRRRTVLHLKLRSLIPEEVAQVAQQPGFAGNGGASRGPHAGPQTPTAPESGPQEWPGQADGARNGPPGPLGPLSEGKDTKGWKERL